MIKLTEILAKPIISLNNCKIEGIVNNAVFDRNFKRLKYLVLFDNDEYYADKSLCVNSIYSYGENAIIIKNDDSLELKESTMQTFDRNSVINCNCYTYLGNFVGKITDVILDEKYYIQYLCINDKTIDIKDVINTGENTVIIQDKDKRVNVSTLKRKSKKCVKLDDIKVDNSQKVYILNSIENNDKLKDEVNENSADENKTLEENLILNYEKSRNNAEKNKVIYELTDSPTQPKMITTNFQFLIGRKLERNIYSSNSELIARKNSKITEDIIKKARLFSKTRELIKFSK